MGVLVTSYLNGDQIASQDAASDHAEMATEHPTQESTSVDDSNTKMMEEADQADGANSSVYVAKEEILPLTSVYQTDLDSGFKELHLGVSSQAEAVPVTFLISKEKIAEDFNDNPSELELYRKYAGVIHENAFGFSEYHLMAGEFKEEGDLIIHVLPEQHTFDLGSASEAEYLNIVQSTFTEYQQVKVVNKDGSQAEFGNIGLMDPIPLTKGHIKKAYYLFTLENGQPALAPWYHENHDDLESALNAMKESKSDFYKALIPEDINFTVSEEKGLAQVTFTETLDLHAMNQEDALRMVEGFLLTAASFDQQIQFHNVQQEEWNGFNFTEPLPKPIGPNRYYLNS